MRPVDKARVLDGRRNAHKITFDKGQTLYIDHGEDKIEKMHHLNVSICFEIRNGKLETLFLIVCLVQVACVLPTPARVQHHLHNQWVVSENQE